MRAGQITVSTRAFAVVDVPTPDAGAGQVRIKVAAAVCVYQMCIYSKASCPPAI